MRANKSLSALAVLFMSMGLLFAAAAQDTAKSEAKEAKKEAKKDKKAAKNEAKEEKSAAPAKGDPVLDAIDKTADPCVDFYSYACGNWRKNNPLPGDQSRYGRFTELLERNNLILKDILEKASANNPGRSATDQKIGDYYAACMDEATVNKKGAEPVQDVLNQVDALASKDALTDLLISLHKKTIPGFFSYYSQPDFKDASKVIANMDQGGMGLPSRDYYFEEDARMKGIREKYVEHVSKMLQLSGYAQDKAEAGAKAVMQIETALAKGALTPVEQRDPQIQYHPMTITEFEKSSPSIAWGKYISGVGTPPVNGLNVVVPKFVDALEGVIKSSSIDDLKTYMRWNVVRDAAPYLSDAFVNENFNFYSKTMRGQKEIKPRWKRCVAQVDNALGEALGIAYVERTLGKEGKAKTLELVGGIESAMENDLHTLDWMSEATKKMALVKLHAVANKIGYPDKWRDYSSVSIDRNDLIGNAVRASQFEFQRQLNKIGKPVDKTEWGMTPPTVNAYYNPQENNINFPAGILQPPFFYKDKDDAINYGAIGVVVGHELTHGFDDQGRQFDAEGNLRDWWTPEDNKKFDELAGCLVNQYGGYVAVNDDPPLKLNGKLTLGENGADNAGMRLAWMALMEDLKKKGKAKVDGYSPEQRFFLGFAQVWCENTTDESSRVSAKTNPHSPGRYRANGTISNMPEFQKAFSCKAGQPMAPEKRCRVW